MLICVLHVQGLTHTQILEVAKAAEAAEAANLADAAMKRSKPKVKAQHVHHVQL
jgi:hypothetical protein